MQPNKSILLRAVDDANNSTKSSTHTVKHKSIADEKLEKIRSRRMAGLKENNDTENNNGKIELFSEHYRQSHQISNASTKRLKTTENNNSNKEEQDSTSYYERRIDTDKRMVHIDSPAMEDSMSQDTPPPLREPKFIITMNGLDDERFMKNVKKRSLSDMDADEEETSNRGLMEDQEMEVADSMMTSSEANKKKLIRCTFWPMCDKGEQCPYLHPNKQCTTFPACQFGQLCHFLHPSCKFDGFCTRSDCPYTHVIKKPGVGAPASLSTNIANKEAASLNISIKPDNVEAGTDAVGKTTAKSNVTPKITINKIQPYYSLVNASTANTTSTSATTKLSNVNSNVTSVSNTSNILLYINK
jgi:hypothetical protein